MSHTLKASQHTIRKYTRQARTGQKFHSTATNAAAAEAYANLRAAAWAEAPSLVADMPLHQFTQSGLSDRYDAAKYVGDFDVSVFAQHAYATAACYSLKIPDDAQAGDPCDIEALRLNAFGDRWLQDGAIIAIHVTDSPTPPADWADILTAADAQTDPLMAVTPSNTGPDSREEITLTPAAPVPVDAYLHIVIRLADYLTHRGAWIEGSAIIAAQTIEVDYTRAVTPDPVPVDLYAPMRAAGPRKMVIFQHTNDSLLDPWLRKAWGTGMLTRGRIALSTATPATYDEPAAYILSPQSSLAGTDIIARGTILPLHVPANNVTAGRAWITVKGTVSGASPVRLSLYSAEPDPAAAATWEGTGANCVGTIVLAGLANNQVIGIPLARAVNGDLWAVAGIAEVVAADHTGISGWTDAEGFDFADAHIASARHESDHDTEWAAFDGEATGGLLFPLLLGSSTQPEHYALSRNGAAYRDRTSYADWAVAPASAAITSASGAADYVAVVSSFNQIGVAGTLLPAGMLDDIAALDADPIVAIAATASGLLVMQFDSVAEETYLAFCGDLKTLFTRHAAWSDPVKISGGGGIVVAVLDGAIARVDGPSVLLAGAAVTAVEALASVVDIRASETHIIARHADDTVSVISNTSGSGYDAGHGIDTSGWTGVVEIAAARNAVFGRQTDGTLLRSGILGWADFTEADARGVTMLTGSGYRRAALRLAPTA